MQRIGDSRRRGDSGHVDGTSRQKPRDACEMTAAFPNVPTLLLGLIIVLGSCVATIAFTLLVRPLIKRAAIEGHNDIVGFVFAAVGVIYGVLLAFVVTDVWGSFETADRATAQQSSVLLAT